MSDYRPSLKVLPPGAFTNGLSGYVFSSLREGSIAPYRGSGNGLTPILLVAAEETSLGGVERLEHEYALKSELDAEWAARPVALTYDSGRMTLVLEDPGGTPLDQLLGGPVDVSPSRLAIRPGQLVGDVSAYSGLASPADVVARGPGSLAKWDLRHVREFTASRPELRANLLRIVSLDIAAKLRDIASPSLAAEELVPK